MAADPSVSPADTPLLWNDRLEAAFQVYLEWHENLPIAILMDKILKAAGTRDLIVERDALLAVGERDGRRIAQLTEALEEVAGELRPAKIASSLSADQQLVALWEVVRYRAEVARAVLAGEENGP